MLVHTLICQQHLWFAVPCLRSLLTCCADPVRLIIHDDGSLTQESADLMASTFSDSVFVPRRSADDQVFDTLAKLPHMAKARSHLPHVIKLCDVALTHPEPIVRYVDTDVLFQRRFRGMFPASPPSTSGAFMMDSDNSFGAHPGDFWPLGPLRLARCLNSGLFWIQRDRIDFERMEYLFKRWGPERIRRYHGWFEQTVWADQAWRSRCSMFDATQLGTASPQESCNRQLIGVHYVTPTRTMLKERLDSAAKGPSSSLGSAPREAEEIRLQSSKTFGLIGAAWIVARAQGQSRSAG